LICSNDLLFSSDDLSFCVVSIDGDLDLDLDLVKDDLIIFLLDIIKINK
jgi:hypothetical protein